MLEEFKKGDYHMALVERLVKTLEDEKELKCELVGLVTLEFHLNNDMIIF